MRETIEDAGDHVSVGLLAISFCVLMAFAFAATALVVALRA